MKVKMFCLLLLLIFVMSGCSSTQHFSKLEKSSTIEIKTMKNGKEVKSKIENEDQVKALKKIVQEAEETETPERAKGIKAEVTENTSLINFIEDNATFFYIGEGYLFASESNKYYKVSKQIEEYLE